MHGRLIASFIAFSVTMGNALAADTIKIAYRSCQAGVHRLARLHSNTFNGSLSKLMHLVV